MPRGGVFPRGRLIGHAGLNFIEQFDGVSPVVTIPTRRAKAMRPEVHAPPGLPRTETLGWTRSFTLEGQPCLARGDGHRPTYRKASARSIVWYDVDRASYAERTSSAAR